MTTSQFRALHLLIKAEAQQAAMEAVEEALHLKLQSVEMGRVVRDRAISLASRALIDAPAGAEH